MRAFYTILLLITLVALALLTATHPEPLRVVELEDVWSELLNATEVENTSAVLAGMELYIENGSIGKALIHFCDSQKCYEAKINNWLSVREVREEVGYAHPLKVLKYVGEVIEVLNMTDANVSVEVADKEVHGCYALKDGFIIPIKMLKSEGVYVISVNSKRFVLWKDVINTDFVEPVFFVKILDFDGKAIENATVIVQSDANPLYRFKAKTNESGIAEFKNRYILKIFEYPFEVIIEANDLSKRTTIFNRWNAELSFSEDTKLIVENLKLELEIDDIVRRGIVSFKPKLINEGDNAITIHFGHLHPFRIEVRNESGLVCKLPELQLSVLSKRTVEPESELSANMSCRIEESGVYEVTAIVKVSAYGDLREEIVLRSNPVILRVI
ncbi:MULTISPECIES: hypothetical protein [unclassified Archaeoglobus]|jgi:hypothetical protein|uniref:hypothetical protein n=1 Tax=unclassified Archaeoglobus TaxID=2643606 RepID=UPI0025C01D12|nr:MULTISPECIES: hypothetical protein [unclassified Archaeoglobus]